MSEVHLLILPQLIEAVRIKYHKIGQLCVLFIRNKKKIYECSDWMWHPSLHILKVPARYFKWVSQALKVSRRLKIGPLNHPIVAVFPTKRVELGLDVDILKCHIILISIYQIPYSFCGRGSLLSSDGDDVDVKPITEIISRHSYFEKWWCIMSAHPHHTVYL